MPRTKTEHSTIGAFALMWWRNKKTGVVRFLLLGPQKRKEEARPTVAAGDVYPPTRSIGARVLIDHGMITPALERQIAAAVA